MVLLSHRAPLVIGLTGGIGSGKSEVLKIFEKMGFSTRSSDEISHQVTKKGQPAYRAIIRHFGPEVLGPGKEIDRKSLARIVFSAPKERRHLERIVHPQVIRQLKEAKKRNRGLLALDIPLLYEARLEKLVDKVVVVYCRSAQQLERLTRHRKMTRTEALKRIKAQWRLSDKCLRADFVIDNTGDLAALKNSTQKLLRGWNCPPLLKEGI